MIQMKFGLFGVIIMMVAIGFGGLIGSGVAGMFGLVGGIIGSLVVGFIVYIIYAVLMGVPINPLAGAVFAIMVWIANMFAGVIQSMTGLGGGIIGLAISAVILSIIWGNYGASIAGQPTATGKTKKKSKRKK